MSRIAAVLLTASSLAWIQPALGTPKASPRSREEDQVYRAFLAGPTAEKGDYLLYQKLGIFFIYNVRHERPEELLAFFRDRAGVALDPAMVRDFVTINRTPRRIDRKAFPPTMKYSTQFIQKDVYSLSRVGFNARQDEAFFYATFASLMEDGHGSLVYLKKTAGSWAVVKAAAVWMYGASVHPFNP
jgi:hypothetical protein